MENNTTTFISTEEFLKQWQGHRGLTRRVIEAFPEKEMFDFSIGGMRTFAQLVDELISIATPGLQEIISLTASPLEEGKHTYASKAEILKRWDEDTETINKLWKEIPSGRFQETHKLFGQYEDRISSSLQYFVDNEIHHRGQGYVYLRALGIEPPFFWER
jgi:uncharacterized damage-inducible protein DinB